MHSLVALSIYENISTVTSQNGLVTRVKTHSPFPPLPTWHAALFLLCCEFVKNLSSMNHTLLTFVTGWFHLLQGPAEHFRISFFCLRLNYHPSLVCVCVFVVVDSSAHKYWNCLHSNNCVYTDMNVSVEISV